LRSFDGLLLHSPGEFRHRTERSRISCAPAIIYYRDERNDRNDANLGISGAQFESGVIIS
jgi:hypothetical protein